MNQDCLFCKIAAGEISSELIYEDKVCVAFRDINPQAPTHILFVPREHFSSLDNAKESHKEILGHLLLKAADVARKQKISERGYRMVINTNEEGGQTVFHLHFHLLGGRQFTFPPG